MKVIFYFILFFLIIIPVITQNKNLQINIFSPFNQQCLFRKLDEEIPRIEITINISENETIEEIKLINYWLRDYFSDIMIVDGEEKIKAFKYSFFLSGVHKITYFLNKNQNEVNFNSLFYNKEEISFINFSNINITNMSDMFYNCINLSKLDLSSIQTSLVTDMNGLFYNCKSLKNVDLSKFDTSSVQYMHYMFYNCFNLESMDLTNFNTKKVTSMYYMFNNCSSLTSLKLSKFDTTNVLNMNNMFYNCKKLENVDFSSFKMSSLKSADNMFYNCNQNLKIEMKSFKKPYSSLNILEKCDKCIISGNDEYCGDNLDRKNSKNVNKLLPLWIVLGCLPIVGGITFIIIICVKNKGDMSKIRETYFNCCGTCCKQKERKNENNNNNVINMNDINIKV